MRRVSLVACVYVCFLTAQRAPERTAKQTEPAEAADKARAITGANHMDQSLLKHSSTHSYPLHDSLPGLSRG